MKTPKTKRTRGPRPRTMSTPGRSIAAQVRAAARLVVIAVLVACQPPPEPVRLGFFTWPGYEPLALAADLGLYERPVRVVDYSSATQVLRAFRNGDIELAALSLDETLLLAEDVPEVRIMAERGLLRASTVPETFIDPRPLLTAAVQERTE